MGKRRMFSKDIVRSDAFLELPISSQALYFQLGMDTDDRGYIPNARSLVRMLGANQGDLEPLIAKGFILVRGDSLILQKHFRINNYIQRDRFKETTYINDLKQLFIEENGAYTTDENKGIPSDVYKIDTECIQNGYDSYTKCIPKISKDKLSKDKLIIDELDENKTASADFVKNDFVKRLINGNYIQQNDLELEKYKELYELLKTHYSDKRIAIVLSYTIEWAKNRTIKNKYGYLEKSMLTNLHQLQRLEERVFEHENEIAKEIFKNNEERFKGL